MATRAPAYTAAPRYTLREIATMWFVHQGQAYCVQSAPDGIIRQATQAMIHEPIVKDVLRKSHLDHTARWFVICEASLALYATRQEAQATMKKG